MSPLTREQRIANGKKGGAKTGAKATAKRLAKWAALGIDPDLGERIYLSGYMCAAQQLRRKKIEQPAVTA